MVANTVNTFINGLYNGDEDTGMKMLQSLKDTSTFGSINVILKQKNLDGIKYVRQVHNGVVFYKRDCESFFHLKMTSRSYFARTPFIVRFI